MDLEDGGMVIRLSPEAADTLREIAKKFGYEPMELVRVGLSFINLLHENQEKGLRIAIVDKAGEPLHEVVIPQRNIQHDSTADVVKKILEDAHPSESLWRSIADLDPDRPDSKNHGGHGRF